MANSNIETSFQNLVNVIKERTFSATDGANLQADIADIKIDITDLGISKIGISQIGMANGVAGLGNDGKVPSSQLPAMTIPVTSVNNKTGDVVLTPSDIAALGISQVGMANGVAGLNSEGKLDFDDIDADIVSKADLEDMWDGEDLPNLPSGYTMLSYIQNTDAQWINTGVSVTENTSADLIGLTPVEASRYGTFLGEGDQSGRIWSIRYKADSGVIQFQLGDDDKAINGPTLVNGSEYNVHAEIGKLVVNGTEYTGSGQSLGVPIATLRIFDNGSGERARAKLFRCKIYESGVLIRDFIAAKRGTDNAIGMYDVVSNTFYGNNGNGDFTAGSPVGTRTSIGNSSTFKNLIDIVQLNMLPISRVGLAGGVASLGNDGKVPSEQLPDLAQVAYSGSYNDLEDAPNWTSVADTEPKTWEGITAFTGEKIWSDGTDIYYSNGSSNQYVLDKTTSTWSQKTWYGLTNFSATELWVDPDGDVYYSYNNTQYKLDKETSTWNPQTWYEIDPGTASYVWNDGENVYYSNNTTQYVLDKQTSTWSQKTWTGLTRFYGKYIWTDGTDIYYSYNTNHYVLDKATSTWSQKTWNGLDNFDGNRVWFDGDDIYYSYSQSNKHYVFDKTNNIWVSKIWSNNIDGLNMWNCDDKTYYSNGGGSGTQFEIVHKDLSELVGKAGGLATLGSDGKVPSGQLPASMPASDVYAWAKASTKPTYTASEVGAIATTAKGTTNGVASLDSNGKVPISQIPGTVDEIKEGYLNETDGKFYEESTYTTEIPAASDKIYVDLSTNLEYRWGGSAYVEISKSIALGRTASTAFPGDAGKAIEDCVPSGASANNKFATASDIPSVGTVGALNTNGSTDKFLRGDGTWAKVPLNMSIYTHTETISGGTVLLGMFSCLIDAICTSNEYILLPYKSGYDRRAVVLNTSMQIVTSGTITIKQYYVP